MGCEGGGVWVVGCSTWGHCPGMACLVVTWLWLGRLRAAEEEGHAAREQARRGQLEDSRAAHERSMQEQIPNTGRRRDLQDVCLI